MSNIIKTNELVAFHPGYYISELIDSLGISQAEFAYRIGTTSKTVSKLVNGEANISNDLAKKLSMMFGTSSELWLNLQSKYDQKIIEIQKEEDFECQKTVASYIDYSYFVKLELLKGTRDAKEKIENLCSFLRVSDLRILQQPDFLVNYRTSISNIEQKNIVCSQAWVQTALNVSENIDTMNFDADKLKLCLPEIRSMTIQSPELFVPRLKEIFASCGVAFVLLPNLKNSGVNGAVKWVSNNRVVLALNDRGAYADIFWFSLFHEIKHVLQQKVKTIFILENNDDIVNANELLELEANNFAANYLISKSQYKEFSPNRYTSDQEIIRFAENIGVHPGIVAGRMQYDNIIPHNRCTQLREKYDLKYNC